MKSILDPTFQYTPAYLSDIRVRFAEIRRQEIVAAALRVAEKAREQDDTQRIVDIMAARRK